MKSIRKLTVLFDRAIDIMAILAGGLLLFTMLSVGVSVVSRYFLGSPMGWVTEISAYALLYITFLVAAWVLKHEGHVKMDIVLNQLNQRARLMVSVITSAVSTIVCLILSFYAWKVTWELFRTGYFTPTTLELPKSIIVAIIFVGSVMLCVQFLRRTGGYLKSLRALREKNQGGFEEP